MDELQELIDDIFDISYSHTLDYEIKKLQKEIKLLNYITKILWN